MNQGKKAEDYIQKKNIHNRINEHLKATKDVQFWNNPENAKIDHKIHQQITPKSIKIAPGRHLGAVLGGLGGPWGSKGDPVLQKTLIFCEFPPKMGSKLEPFSLIFCIFLNCFSEAFLEGYRTPFLMDLGWILEGCFGCFLVRFSMVL